VSAGQARIGPYTILSEVGRGAMGVVLGARGPSGDLVAVKLCTRLDAEALARFQREIEVQSALGEGFVPILDAGVDSRGPYLVMPLLTGASLRGRLAHGALPVAEAIEVVRELAETVGRAHAAGIVHRDLKPENVLFDARGRPLVADLGLAKHAVGAVDARASLSQSGTLRGTIGYAAPEQLADARSAGPAADVFALGAILYELLSGRPAFPGENVVAIATDLMAGKVEPIRKVRPEVPAWLARVVERALEVSPDDRFQDGAELGRALEGATSGRRLWLAALVFAVVGAGAVALASRRGAGPALVPPPVPTAPTAPAPPAPPASPVATGPPAKPGDADAAVALGVQKEGEGDLAGAFLAYSRALELDPRCVPALANRAGVRVDQGDWQGAVDDATHALEIDPRSAVALGNRGAARGLAREWARSLEDLDRAIELAPRFEQTYENRATVRARVGDQKGALADGETAVALRPRFWSAFMTRGNARDGLGDRAGAVDDYTRALERAPPERRARIYSYRGGSRLMMGEVDAAMEDCSRAIELDPGQVDAWARRGYAHARKNQRDAALDDLGRALALDPRNTFARVVRGDTLRAKGDLDAAGDDFMAALAIDKDALAILGAGADAARRLAERRRGRGR
jgi:serine/threonine-protein kinase